MAGAPADGCPPDTSQRYSLDDNIGVVLQDPELVYLLSLQDPLNGGWKCLAARLNYSFSDISKFESLPEPCKALLQNWQKKPGSTIRVFKMQLSVMNRHDVLARLHSVMKGEFELLGVLQRDGRNEEISVPVYGKITLREAFVTKLAEKGLDIDNLELVHPDGTPSFGISWISPAYTQKGLQVTFRKKTRTVQLRPAEKPSRLRHVASEIDTAVTKPPRVQHSYSNIYYQCDSSWTDMPGFMGSVNTTECRVVQQQPEPSEDPDEHVYENVKSPVSGGGSTGPPAVWPALASEAIRNASSPGCTRPDKRNKRVSEGRPSRAEWECLPGWHPLNDSRPNKHAIREVLSAHLHQDGCYILTPYKTPENIVLTVTYKNATKSFLVKRTKQTGEQPKLYYIYETFQACSVKELIAHYTKHRLGDTVPIKLKKTI